LNYFLTFARLAPVQCTGFGTHGTTGIAAVDYFLSSRLIEPEEAEKHYTETLCQFQTIPTYQRRIPLPPPACRGAFNLPERGHLYFCPQRLSKFHPEFDAILRNILQNDAKGYLILLEGRHKHVAAQLHARFRKTLGPAASRVIFMPPQAPGDYYRLLSLADVLLDPPHYSSSLTGYDAFSLGLPMVTLPGDLMVQRYALGLYRKMGLEDLAAWSAEAYVAMAVRLAVDRDYREAVCRRIAERSEVLFEDSGAVREHEEFFEGALSRVRASEGLR
jgi:predicted O-linked N-acetylglucosamine transferase (SPINDLY family)